MYKRVESKFEELMAVWNPDTNEEGVKKLPLFKGIVGKEEVCGYSLVDSATYDKWSVIMWVQTKMGYVRANFSMRNKDRLREDSYTGLGSKDYLLLHRVVTGLKDTELCVDHMNHIKLDNRSCNLRVVTVQENTFNTQKRQGSSKYKGVSFRKDHTKRQWKMQIVAEGKRLVKSYGTELEAGQAYDRLAKEHFGEFAYLNFPD
jgi:hypothetical protein